MLGKKAEGNERTETNEENGRKMKSRMAREDPKD